MQSINRIANTTPLVRQALIATGGAAVALSFISIFLTGLATLVTLATAAVAVGSLFCYLCFAGVLAFLVFRP